jgi:hypothetical protein
VLHADDPARVLLLDGAERAGLLGWALHPGLAGGEQQVAHLDALVGPVGDRRRRAVLGVVGMGHDDENPPDIGRVEGLGNGSVACAFHVPTLRPRRQSR